MEKEKPPRMHNINDSFRYGISSRTVRQSCQSTLTWTQWPFPFNLCLSLSLSALSAFVLSVSTFSLPSLSVNQLALSAHSLSNLCFFISLNGIGFIEPIAGSRVQRLIDVSRQFRFLFLFINLTRDVNVYNICNSFRVGF